jgi:DNA invertase Pin-like site-specific DNA recombinase
MQVINAVSEFERDLLIERTNSGLQRAKAEGKKFGGLKWTHPSRQRLPEFKLHP